MTMKYRVRITFTLLLGLLVCIPCMSAPTALAWNYGFVKICKAAQGSGVSGNFSFAVAGQTVTVAVGSCSQAIQLPIGKATVSELASAGTVLASVSASPSGSLVSSDLAGRTATVLIASVDSSLATIVTFTNAKPASCTQGFFKNHPQYLPATLTIGGTALTRVQLVAILKTPPRGNGAIILLHQLIAAEANIADFGTPASSGVQAAIAQAGTLLTGVISVSGSGSVRISFISSSQVSALTDILDAFNSSFDQNCPS